MLTKIVDGRCVGCDVFFNAVVEVSYSASDVRGVQKLQINFSRFLLQNILTIFSNIYKQGAPVYIQAVK